jgi:hypothetical protein
MKFTCSVTINASKEKVAAYFTNPDYLKEYQDGFLRKELIFGTPGKVNSISKMYYKQGKGEMELTETVKVNNLPDEFMAQYHHKFTDNTMKSTFTTVNEDETRYDAEIHYTDFRGFMVKIMVFIAPGFFKKQVAKWLHNFKVFVEKNAFI